MIYIYLSEKKLEYEIRELVKLFYFDEDIEFKKDKSSNLGRVNIEIKLYSDKGKKIAQTRVQKEGKYNSESIERLEEVNILEDNEEKKAKIGLKKTLFKALKEIEERKIPWGILTGIRPTKIIHSLYEKGHSYDRIRQVLLDQYLVDREKLGLIEGISQVEKQYIYPLDGDRFSIYISIPFCPTRCLYCSFPSNKLKSESQLDQYLDALMSEIEGISDDLRSKKLHTIYIGGGTPTTLSKDQMDRLLDCLYKNFEISEKMEITVEAGRPDTIDYEKLQALKDRGVKRISINPQTMNQDTLDRIGRDHSVSDIVDSYNMAKEIGFESINMDIIVGLPGENRTHVERTMEEIYKLRPENLTVHTMAIKKSSRLNENISEYNLAAQGEIESMLNITREYAKEMGMRPYYMYRQKQILGNFENIGYSMSGSECVYNIMIMEEKESIMAFGAGAISKIYYPSQDRFERVPNVKDLREYMNRVDEMIERKRAFTEIKN